MFNRNSARMLIPRVLILCAGLLLAGTSLAQQPAPAQPPPAPLPAVAPQYVVSYIEVAPAAAEAAAASIRTYRNEARAQAAAMRVEAYRRVGAPHHFALVEQWRDTAAFMAHGESAYARAFRTALAPHLTAPFDERRHHALNVGPAAEDGAGGVIAVTHVDIIPTAREAGIDSVQVLADQSRGTPGNLRFDALTQSNRTNHMTLVEAWQDQEAYHRHVTSAHLKSFRHALLPRSGSLYDERLYDILD